MVTWFAAFALLWLVAMVWIAIDNDLLGVPYFITHLTREHWPRRFYWIFGWRLIALVLLEACIGLSFLLFARDALKSNSSLRLGIGITLLILMAAAFVLQRPKLHPFFKWQVRQRAIDACKVLGDVVRQFEECQEIGDFTDAAAYSVHDGWLPRHPRGPGPWWPRVVPVSYVRRNGETSVVFPVDWNLFVAWKLPHDFVLTANYLPFEGPHGTTFTLQKAVSLKGYPNWTVLYADFHNPVLDACIAEHKQQ